MNNNNKKELEIIENIYDNGDRYTPKGYVFCYDESGNLLFHTHNMIVESGRRMIFDTLANDFGQNTVLGNSAFFLNRLTAYVGESTELVSAEDTIDKLGKRSIEMTPEYQCDEYNDSNNIRRLLYKYIITYRSKDNKSLNHVSTLGLVLRNTLFSRVAFPKYASSSNKLTFTYYLYF